MDIVKKINIFWGQNWATVLGASLFSAGFMYTILSLIYHDSEKGSWPAGLITGLIGIIFLAVGRIKTKAEQANKPESE